MDKQLTAALAFLGEHHCLAIPVYRLDHGRPLPWFLRADIDVVMI